MASRRRISTITSVTTHIMIRIVHIPFHRSHLSTLKYLRTQANNERPKSMIKDITKLNLTTVKIWVTRSGTSKAKPRTNLF